jgi:hypothetical protein
MTRDVCRVVVLGAALAALSCSGGGGGPASEECKQLMCNERQVCDTSTAPARCKCHEAYTGTSCTSCARGYASVNGTCVAVGIDCSTNPSVCGSRGTCVRSGTVVGDTCVCQAGYDGHACGSCAAGYQMVSGVCQPTCATAMMTCAAPKVCSDATGRATCVCPGNRTGTNCDQCPTGYVLRAADDTCVQTCSSIAACGAHKRCDDSSGTPTCVCADPWTGDSCNSCVAGYMPDGTGNCVRNAPAGTTLIAGGRYQGSEYLIAINPHATPPTATPLRPLSGLSNTRLVTDVAGRTIYTVSTNSISRLDATTGQPTPVASSLPPLQSACFGGGALYTIGSISPYLLTRVDPASGARTDLGPTTLVGAQGMIGLTWESAGKLLYARPPATTQTNGADLFLIDAATGGPTMLGPLTMEANRLRPQDTRMSVAVDGTGKAFLATRIGRLPDEVVIDHCRKLAAGLGYAGYEAAPFTTMEILQTGIGPGTTRVLTSRHSAGPEILAYASSGQRLAAKAMVRIETTNPEAFVCLSTYEETLELQIPGATARFAAIALSGYRPSLNLVVEGSFPAVTKPILHVHQSSGTPPSVFTAYSFSKVYSASDWSKLTLPVYASAWTSDLAAPVVLIELDLATRTMKRQLSFPQVELFPNIAAWTP